MRRNLPYLGNRNYVHGTTIVDMVLAELEPGFPLDVRFQSPILGTVDVRRHPSEKPNVAVSFERDGERVHYGLFDAGRAALDYRVEFDEREIASRFTVGERSVLSAHGADASLIARVVLMNKALMVRVFPAARGKWWFAGLALETWPGRARSIELQFDGGFRTRLTRSIIEVDGDPIGKIFFSLSEGGI
ncbi:MAG: hypothetical protein JOY90_31775 [Bradyrhizobium sp.]|uniref:hypothetical protein n=1 Tax=Bradyrhizobium sp. TaxID=376 RepID=UPI001E0AA0D0|nr:hypothetical protein [Bradyrhizobium sp.]MBV9564992.1 hypothetical protein [Bradyrhizobium sp.]